MIRAVLLSSFDVHLGPTITLSVPVLTRDELTRFKSIPKLIDIIDKEQFFISTIEEIYGANYYFSVENNAVRGKKSLLLLTIGFQIDDDTNRERLLSFLEGKKVLLKNEAYFLSEDPAFKTNGGIFSKDNIPALKSSLHKLHDLAFNTSEFRALLRKNAGKIIVTGPAGLDVAKEIECILDRIKSNEAHDLRNRLITHVIDEFRYEPFTCGDRTSETCEKSNCPVCKVLSLESDAMIYVFYRNNYNLESDFEDMINYITNVERTKEQAILIFQFETGLLGGQKMSGRNEFSRRFKQKLEKILQELGYESLVTYHIITPDNLVPFKQAMSDLVKKLI